MNIIFLWLCNLLSLIFVIYFGYIIILILRNKKHLTVDRKMLFESNEGLKKSSVKEIVRCTTLMLLLFANMIVKKLDRQYKPEDIISFHIFMNGCIVMLILMFYEIVNLIYPLIITEKFFIIKGSIHKNSAIKYFMEEDTLVLIRQKENGKQYNLLRIHNHDTRTIIEVQKYAKQTESNLDCDNNKYINR